MVIKCTVSSIQGGKVLQLDEPVKLFGLVCLSIGTLLFVNAWGTGEVYFIQLPGSLDITSVLAAVFFNVLILSPFIYGIWKGLQYLRR